MLHKHTIKHLALAHFHSHSLIFLTFTTTQLQHVRQNARLQKMAKSFRVQRIKKFNLIRFSKDNFERPTVDYGPVQNDPRCGLSAQSRNVAQRRIVGGNEAGFGSFPWQAYIRVGKKDLIDFRDFITIALVISILDFFFAKTRCALDKHLFMV